MDWRDWIEQRIPMTEIQRGGAAVWPADGDRLIGDSLGPVMHLHDDASEIFYFVSGRCRLEIGASEEFFDPGEFVLVPSGVPHNLWNAGDADLLVFWMVAPNFIDNKWRTDDFPAGAMDRRAVRSKVEPGVDLPSDENIHSRLLELQMGDSFLDDTRAGQEAVLYVVDGSARVKVGKLEGRLSNHEFVHVTEETPFSIQPAGEMVSVLLFQTPGNGA